MQKREAEEQARAPSVRAIKLTVEIDDESQAAVTTESQAAVHTEAQTAITREAQAAVSFEGETASGTSWRMNMSTAAKADAARTTSGTSRSAGSSAAADEGDPVRGVPGAGGIWSDGPPQVEPRGPGLEVPGGGRSPLGSCSTRSRRMNT